MKAILLLILIGTMSFTQAQENSKKAEKLAKKEAGFHEMKIILDSLNFEFTARQVYPTGGKTKQLSSNDYTLQIINDSISVYLPFYGRAYTASYGATDGGIKCNTKTNNYEVTANTKKLSYTVKFSAKGNNDTYSFILSVTGSGSASLSVTSMNKSGISYNGMVTNIAAKE